MRVNINWAGKAIDFIRKTGFASHFVADDKFSVAC